MSTFAHTHDFMERIAESDRFHMNEGKVHQTLRELSTDLGQAGIPYLVIGGMALNAHGYQRETVDVDVLIRPDDLEAFEHRFVGRGYLPVFPGAKKSFRNTKTGVKVEFLTTGEFPGDGKPKPVSFPDPESDFVNAQGIRIAALPTLINLKLASGMTNPGRLRDLADVQELIRVLRLGPGFADELDPYVRDRFIQLQAAVQQDELRGE